MNSFGASGGHEKKLETAKDKKEQADKAFQASDLPTGTSVALVRFKEGRRSTFSGWGDSFEALS